MTGVFGSVTDKVCSVAVLEVVWPVQSYPGQLEAFIIQSVSVYVTAMYFVSKVVPHLAPVAVAGGG